MSNWHTCTPQQTLDELASNTQGLTPDEAAKRYASYGPNRLTQCANDK